MEIPTIKALPRPESGSRACRRLRRQGLVPAVLYGRGESNVLLSVEQVELSKLLSGRSFILGLEWDGNRSPVQIKEIQYDSLGSEILHADFNRISLTETIRVSVQIETHGDAPGVKEGGTLSTVLHDIEVECLPTNIPEKIRVEVSGLKLGEVLRLREVQFPEGVRPIGDPEMVVVMVALPTEVTAAAPAEGEEVKAEPEVIRRAPEEEEELPEAEKE